MSNYQKFEDEQDKPLPIENRATANFTRRGQLSSGMRSSNDISTADEKPKKNDINPTSEDESRVNSIVSEKFSNSKLLDSNPLF